MSKANKVNVKAAVYSYLTNRVKDLGESEFHKIQQESQYGMELAALQFRLSTGIGAKFSTINRYWETYIKANKQLF